MDLKTYIQSAKGNATGLAAGLEIPPTYLSQMARGDRAITAERAARIEALTNKVVRRWDMLPKTWHLIWPELIGADDAPPLPDIEAKAA